MMKPTIWTAILMEVTAVEGVLIQSTVQIVSVIQSHQLFLSAMVILIKICACKGTAPFKVFRVLEPENSKSSNFQLYGQNIFRFVETGHSVLGEI